MTTLLEKKETKESSHSQDFFSNQIYQTAVKYLEVEAKADAPAKVSISGTFKWLIKCMSDEFRVSHYFLLIAADMGHNTAFDVLEKHNKELHTMLINAQKGNLQAQCSLIKYLRTRLGDCINSEIYARAPSDIPVFLKRLVYWYDRVAKNPTAHPAFQAIARQELQEDVLNFIPDMEKNLGFQKISSLKYTPEMELHVQDQDFSGDEQISSQYSTLSSSSSSSSSFSNSSVFLDSSILPVPSSSPSSDTYKKRNELIQGRAVKIIEQINNKILYLSSENREIYQKQLDEKLKQSSLPTYIKDLTKLLEEIEILATQEDNSHVSIKIDSP